MKNKSEYEANNHQNKPLSVDMNLSYPLPKSFYEKPARFNWFRKLFGLAKGKPRPYKLDD